MSKMSDYHFSSFCNFSSLPADSTLVQALVQLGAEITNNREVIRAILARFGISEAAPPVDEQIIEVVSALARLASEGAALCDVGTLVKVLSDLVSLHLQTI